MILFRKNRLFLLFTILILLFLQYTPYLYHKSQTPKDRVYLGAERYPPDYYVYLFYINQGVMGNNQVVDFYTNEKHEPAFVHIEYLLAGKIGGIFGLVPNTIYYLFRSLTLILYALCSFYFISLFLQNSLLHKMVFILSFFWGGIFLPVINQNGISLLSYFDFYQPPDLFNRLMFEPHKFLGMSLFILSFYFISAITSKPKSAHSYRLIAISFPILLLTGIVHAVTSVSIIFTIVFYLLIKVIIDFLSKKNVLKTISSNILIIGLFIPLILPLVYWKINFLHNPVWFGVFHFWEGRFVDIDKIAPLFPAVTGYLFIFGPLFVLAVIGLKKFLLDNQNKGYLLLSFILSNSFLFWFGYLLLGTSKHRYYQTPLLVSLCILAVYGLMVIFKKYISRTSHRGVLLLLVIFLLVLLGIPNAKQGLLRELNQFGTPPDLSRLAYPTQSWYSGLVWLGKNTKTNSVILCLPRAGQIIPGIPGRRVVVGDFVHTYKFYDKLPQVEKFFSGNLTLTDARAYLKKEKVDYVFVGDEEKSKGNINNYGNILTPVFENSDVTIFKTSL